MADIITHVPTSSAITSSSYNPATKRMSVTFKSGKTYTYENVSRQRFTAFTRAKSAGSFINRSIKPSVGKSARPVKGSLSRALRAKGSGTGGRTDGR